ncbi:rod-binding protein [Limnohabitans sp.]|jgi:Rod binding domain-containing protein|uniref:rod-binding protein n=1 Tax=Limnohabitans sp. TaxID=1907725 RepID=UPI002FDCB00C
MSSPVDTSAARSYTDFTGLGELRGKAQKDQNSALRESAQQFEGLFIQMMLKSMREANEPMKDDDNKSQALDTFEGMFDKEVSLQMSKRGALGVADFMERAVKQQQAPAPSTDELLKSRGKGIALNPKQQPVLLPTAAELSKGFALEKALPLKSLNEFKSPLTGGRK